MKITQLFQSKGDRFMLINTPRTEEEGIPKWLELVMTLWTQEFT